MRTHRQLLVLVALVAAAAPAWSAEIDGVHPGCGAPGDLIYVQGTELAPQPTVTLAGVRAEVVRMRAGVLLCRVPQDVVEGNAELRVDGALASGAFHVLAAGRPVVHGLSAATGTCGQALFAFGRRLHNSRVSFVDRHGRTAATIGVVGGRRAALLVVPDALEPGAYEVVFTNGDGLSTGASSPRFDLVDRQGPELNAIHPALGVSSRCATPGQRIRCIGTDLGSRGPCRVHWRDRDGVSTQTRGCSNGYDTVLTTVPTSLAAGEPYEVRIELGSGDVTPPATWIPAKRAAPGDAELDPPTGPAGSYVAVRGSGLCGCAADVRVVLTSDQGTVPVDVVCRHPGGLGSGAAWILRIPEGLAEGDYDLALRVDEWAPPTMRYRVADQPLTVTGLWPSRPIGNGAHLPTLIRGAGFGSASASDDLRVVWTNGERTREGTIVFRADRVIRVLPYSAYPEAPPLESWSVYVLRGRGTATRAVKAGTVYFGDS